MRPRVLLIGVALCLFGLAGLTPALASPAWDVTVDELGHGTLRNPATGALTTLGWATLPDPLNIVQSKSVLTYFLPLPIAPTTGFVRMWEPELFDELSDVIYFVPGTSQFVFYSDGADGIHEPLADIPEPEWTQLVQFVQGQPAPPTGDIPEISQEGIGYGEWSPGPGQAGWNLSPEQPLNYKFISDVPEPASALIWLAMGVLGVAAFVARPKLARSHA